jgi:hypothetical protein
LSALRRILDVSLFEVCQLTYAYGASVFSEQERG